MQPLALHSVDGRHLALQAARNASLSCVQPVSGLPIHLFSRSLTELLRGRHDTLHFCSFVNDSRDQIL